jgi:predicted glycosyltransferase
MNLLRTKVPALVYPYHRQREQPLRVEIIKKMLPLRILHDHDLEPSALSRHIRQMLQRPPPFEPVDVDLNGAQRAARYLEKWIKENAEPAQAVKERIHHENTKM